MKAVIQRVTRGSVEIDGRRVAEIGPGLVILLGIGPGDTPGVAAKLARKIAMMRIFGDENGKMNLSVLDVQGAAIVVSQFTLYADTRKGHRPAFTDAAPPEIASPLCDQFVAALREAGIQPKPVNLVQNVG
jgi:D-tyrosyl-tRNA(Tyr) deacylase